MAKVNFLGGETGDKLISVEIATEETVKKGRLALGATGLLFFGPVGILAVMLARKKTTVTFIATFADGKKGLMSCAQKDYPRWVRLALNNAAASRPVTSPPPLDMHPMAVAHRNLAAGAVPKTVLEKIVARNKEERERLRRGHFA